MIATRKTSISLTLPMWDLLQEFSNKSAVITEALELFFAKKSALVDAEKIYWEKIESSLRGENNDYVSINPGNKEISPKLLDETLWK